MLLKTTRHIHIYTYIYIYTHIYVCIYNVVNVQWISNINTDKNLVMYKKSIRLFEQIMALIATEEKS